MIKKSIYGALFVFFGAITLIYAMQQQPDAPYFLHVNQRFIKIQPVPLGQELIFPGASPGYVKDGFEMFDITKDEPLLATPFRELMQAKANQGLPFILAVVSQGNAQDNKIRRAYYDATGLNKALFGSILFNQFTNQLKYNKTRNTMSPDELRDPYSRQYISHIHYFSLNPQAMRATFLGTDSDLFENTKIQRVLTLLFYYYDLLRDQLLPQIESQHILQAKMQLADLAFMHQNEPEAVYWYMQLAEQDSNLNYKAIALQQLGGFYCSQKNYAEAERCWCLAAGQEVNQQVKLFASSDLGNLYLRQNNIPKAIHYLQITADQKGDLQLRALAYFNLGNIYKVLKNYPETQRYYALAAEQNDNLEVKRLAQEELRLVQEAPVKKVKIEDDYSH